MLSFHDFPLSEYYTILYFYNTPGVKRAVLFSKTRMYGKGSQESASLEADPFQTVTACASASRTDLSAWLVSGSVPSLMALSSVRTNGTDSVPPSTMLAASAVRVSRSDASA